MATGIPLAIAMALATRPSTETAPVGEGPRTLTAVPGIRVGHAVVPGGGSGCTVVTGPFRARVQVRGLGSGSRELATLEGAHATTLADAILLTGGSAFGLAAAQGVMDVLKSEGLGHETPAGRVPIVPGAVLFDLAPARRRPGPEEGRAACLARSPAPVPQGRRGAGTGAFCGKLDGIEKASPGGVGSAALGFGGWTAGALAVVNAVGDVLGPDGSVVAGSGGSRRLGFDDWQAPEAPGPGTNTTLCVVGTDAPLGVGDLERVLQVACTALGRRIDPVNTAVDGDVVFAVATDLDPARPRMPVGPLMALATAARRALEASILQAVGFHDHGLLDSPDPTGAASA